MSTTCCRVSIPADRPRARFRDVLWAFLIIIATATIMVASRPATATGGAALTLTVEDQQFAIARSDVIALRVGDAPNGRATMHLLLTAEAASDLSAFTRAGLGGEMIMALPGEMVSTARLDQPIDSGYIGLTFANPVRAMRIARLIGGDVEPYVSN